MEDITASSSFCLAMFTLLMLPLIFRSFLSSSFRLESCSFRLLTADAGWNWFNLTDLELYLGGCSSFLGESSSEISLSSSSLSLLELLSVTAATLFPAFLFLFFLFFWVTLSALPVCWVFCFWSLFFLYLQKFAWCPLFPQWGQTPQQELSSCVLLSHP